MTNAEFLTYHLNTDPRWKMVFEQFWKAIDDEDRRKNRETEDRVADSTKSRIITINSDSSDDSLGNS